MWTGGPFSGTKIALVCGAALIAYLRDHKEDIPFPGMWDLPGGGREGEESPVECVIREVEEEFGLRIAPERIQKLRRYGSPSQTGLDTYFCVASVGIEEVERIQFGEEGQRWSLMPITDFIAHEDAVPHLQKRLVDLLAEN